MGVEPPVWDRGRAPPEKLRPYPSLIIGTLLVAAITAAMRAGKPRSYRLPSTPEGWGGLTGGALGDLLGCFLVAGVVWAVVWFGFLR